MDFQDKTITCSDCGVDFVFTAGEQQFYNEKGFTNEPRRCRGCRARKKGSGPGDERNGGGSRGGGGSWRGEHRGGGGRAGGSEGAQYTAVCSSCGGTARLSFQPSPDRPVFCRTCFQSRARTKGSR